MKNSKDTIGNGTHDLPACSAVFQQTAPPSTPPLYYIFNLCTKNGLYKIENYI